MTQVEKLIADVKMCNNGYIFVATSQQVLIAQQNPSIFKTFGVGFNGNPKIALK